MKKILLAIGLLIASGYSMAMTVRCNGVDGFGNSIYLIMDSNLPTVNINGDILRVVGKTRNNQGVMTEQFINVYGTYVYDSLVPVNLTMLSIYQFNAVTQSLLGQALLNCQASGNMHTSLAASSPPSSQLNIIDLPLFSPIKATTFGSTGGMPFNN